MELSWERGPGVRKDAMDSKTVLILFVVVVFVIIYLVSLLLIVIRRAKKLIQLHNRRYYLVIAFYIASKLVICGVLIIEIIVGQARSWENLSGDSIELMIKTGIVLADFSIIELFLISLEHYFDLCLSTLKDQLSKKQSKAVTLTLRTFQVLVCLIMLIPLAVLDLTEMAFNVLNGIGLGLNLLVMLIFLGTFFYFNFKMTGVLVEERLNSVIKRVYKVQLIIMMSRLFMITFEMLMALQVKGSFQDKVAEYSQSLTYEVVLAILFIGSILLQLFAEGLPVMYSLRSNVLHAMNYKPSTFEYKESIFTGYSQDLEQSLIENNQQDNKEEDMAEMKLNNFRQMEDVAEEEGGEESIWVMKRGCMDQKKYIIRISKHEISSFIFEDIANEIALWNELKLPALSRISYFYEGEIIHLVEKYYQCPLDTEVDRLHQDKPLLGLALRLAEAIHQLHQNDIVHGCITASHVFLERGKVVLNGCGLHSMRKYLSLITGYTNKTMYTAIEHFRDRNKVILKPQPPADVYSFGIILYEIVTKNRQYRQLTLMEVSLKFAEDNFRPKLPEHVRPEVKTLIRRCWHESPEKRPELEQVIDLLRRLL